MGSDSCKFRDEKDSLVKEMWGQTERSPVQPAEAATSSTCGNAGDKTVLASAAIHVISDDLGLSFIPKATEEAVAGLEFHNLPRNRIRIRDRFIARAKISSLLATDFNAVALRAVCTGVLKNLEATSSENQPIASRGTHSAPARLPALLMPVITVSVAPVKSTEEYKPPMYENPWVVTLSVHLLTISHAVVDA